MVRINPKSDVFPEEASVKAEERSKTPSEQKTERAAGGIFKKIGNWFEHTAFSVLKKSWRWLVLGAAAVVGTIATVALVVLFGKTAERSASKGLKKNRKPGPILKKGGCPQTKVKSASAKKAHVGGLVAHFSSPVKDTAKPKAPKKIGKLNAVQLNLKINPAGMLPGAKPAAIAVANPVEPAPKSDRSLVDFSRVSAKKKVAQKGQEPGYIEKLKSRPIGPAKRSLPSRFAKKGV